MFKGYSAPKKDYFSNINMLIGGAIIATEGCRPMPLQPPSTWAPKRVEVQGAALSPICYAHSDDTCPTNKLINARKIAPLQGTVAF